MWTLQDVDDELTAGQDLMQAVLTSDGPDDATRFHRACRHFDRAQSLLSVVRYYAQQANAAAIHENPSPARSEDFGGSDDSEAERYEQAKPQIAEEALLGTLGQDIQQPPQQVLAAEYGQEIQQGMLLGVPTQQQVPTQEVPTQHSITQAPVELDPPSPSVFMVNRTDIATAYGGPYRGETLVIPSGYRRWILKDIGGQRVSFCATPEKGPSDAANDVIARTAIEKLTVEGYYQFDINGHCWEPIVQLGSLKTSPA